MTLKEIADRLEQEFPGRSMQVCLTVWSHADQVPTFRVYEISIWDTKLQKHIYGSKTIDDAIARMKFHIATEEQPTEQLNKVGNMEVTPEIPDEQPVQNVLPQG